MSTAQNKMAWMAAAVMAGTTLFLIDNGGDAAPIGAYALAACGMVAALILIMKACASKNSTNHYKQSQKMQ